MGRPDKDCVETLYDAHAASMYSYALALLGNAEEAEDAVQDVFLRVCASGETPRNPRHYLLRCIRNEAFSRLRKRRLRFWKRKELARETPLLVQANGHDEELAAAFKLLPVDQREAVLLKVYEGLTFQEVADVTGVSPNTAASRYRYGIEKLRELLRKETADE